MASTDAATSRRDEAVTVITGEVRVPHGAARSALSAGAWLADHLRAGKPRAGRMRELSA
jgi:uncharacterized cupin superfamily protein